MFFLSLEAWMSVMKVKQESAAFLVFLKLLTLVLIQLQILDVTTKVVMDGFLAESVDPEWIRISNTGGWIVRF